MADHTELMVLRAMAWERAKGELRSMLQTYINDRATFEQAENAINGFIEHVEDQGMGIA